MLTIKEFEDKFKTKCWGEFIGSNFYLGTEIIKQGMLEFTETACCFGGPFAERYAQFVLIDYSKSYFKNGDLVTETFDRGIKKRKEETERKIKSGFLKPNKNYKEVQEYPSVEKPIRIWLLGNDDTSYSKFYKTVEEALDELDLFIVAEPLDFHEIIEGFNFVFSN